MPARPIQDNDTERSGPRYTFKSAAQRRAVMQQMQREQLQRDQAATAERQARNSETRDVTAGAENVGDDDAMDLDPPRSSGNVTEHASTGPQPGEAGEGSQTRNSQQQQGGSSSSQSPVRRSYNLRNETDVKYLTLVQLKEAIMEACAERERLMIANRELMRKIEAAEANEATRATEVTNTTKTLEVIEVTDNSDTSEVADTSEGAEVSIVQAIEATDATTTTAITCTPASAITEDNADTAQPSGTATPPSGTTDIQTTNTPIHDNLAGTNADDVPTSDFFPTLHSPNFGAFGSGLVSNTDPMNMDNNAFNTATDMQMDDWPGTAISAAQDVSQQPEDDTNNTIAGASTTEYPLLQQDNTNIVVVVAGAAAHAVASCCGRPRASRAV
ncbi:uncharacterized protein K452DRAFT_318083, partial [Aplosporella prunicola CBS 121167]